MQVKLSLAAGTYDKLRRAQALLSHAVPSGDVAEVFDRALDALLTQLERRKRAATATPRKPATPKPRRARTIPANVRRAVWERDRGRCAFVGENGHRCASRRRLEFDHVRPLARGGESSIDNVRLLCRAHNQYSAERALGAEFMAHRRRGAGSDGHAPRSSAPGLQHVMT